MIIRIALFFLFIASLFFLLMAMIYRIGEYRFADTVCVFAMEVFIAGSTLLLLQGIMCFCADVWRQFCQYLSATNRAERRLKFIMFSQRTNHNLHQNKLKQFYYRAELKRQRIIRSNKRKPFL